MLNDADEALEGFFFSHFSLKEKKCAGRQAGECAAGWARQLIHAERSSNGSCRSRCALEARPVGEDGGMWMRLPSGWWMLLGSDENVYWDEPC